MHTLKYKNFFMNLVKRLSFKEYISIFNVVYICNVKNFKTNRAIQVNQYRTPEKLFDLQLLDIAKTPDININIFNL